MKKRLLSLLLALTLVCSLLAFPANAAEVVDSGTCGENVTWVLTDDGVLTISGTGAMEDYANNNQVPWDNSREKIMTAVIEPGVTSIGYGAFSGCSSLTNVTIPDSVTSIEWGAFSNCSSITSVTIPDSVTSIGSYAFYRCKSLTSVTIPDSVTSIGNYAFDSCNSLTSVTIPNSITSIGSGAFTGCSGLTSVTIPDSVTSIGGYAFSYCSSLTSVTIPDSVTSIGESAFSGCSSLTSVTIPDSVTSIGWYAFRNCNSLPSVTIPDSVTSIEGSAFSGCSSLTNITIPEGITEIGFNMFGDCAKLKAVTLPKSLTKVETNAFDGTLVKDVYFGGSLEDWENVVIKSGNDVLRFATVHFAEGASNPLEIIANPADTASLSGQIAYFSVTASGDIASYQWQVKVPGRSWKNSTATGCKTATLEITATEARNGYQYRCIVTDKDGNSVTSEPATLTVAEPVVITGSPMDSVGKAGQIAAFAVWAEGAGLTYQWQYSDNGGQSWKNSSVKAAIYSTKMTAARNGRMVRCVVSDQFGNTATSDTAVMLIKQPLVITSLPKDYVGKAGSTATFSVLAQGRGLTYQWQISDDGFNWANSSVKAASYSTKLTTAKNGRMVRCIVTDANGNSVTSSAARMTIG